MNEYKTQWWDDEDVEWTVRIDYDFQPFEPMTLNYPGCYADVTVTAVYKELRTNWVDVTEETERRHIGWEVEILESINEQAQDAEDAHGDMLYDQMKDDALTGDV